MWKVLCQHEVMVLSLVLLVCDLWRACITWIIQIILKKKENKNQIGENKEKLKGDVESWERNIWQTYDLYSSHKLASGLN